MTSAKFFTTPARFRNWLAKYSGTKDELLVGFYKKGTGRPSITWPESVDEALCYGWIDGIRRRIDDESYSIRFTPRRKRSIWSERNLGRVEVLIAEGRMQPSGMAAYERRTAERSVRYAYEQQPANLTDEYEKQMRANTAAWEYFESLRPSIRQPSTWWVLSAKQESTRRRRLQQLIDCCERRELLPQFIRTNQPRKKK